MPVSVQKANALSITCFNLWLALKWSGSWTRWSLKAPSSWPIVFCSVLLDSTRLDSTRLFFYSVLSDPVLSYCISILSCPIQCIYIFSVILCHMLLLHCKTFPSLNVMERSILPIINKEKNNIYQFNLSIHLIGLTSQHKKEIWT